MIVKDNQTLPDIATQYLGSADAAYDIALLNDLSITDELEIGRELLLPPVVNAEIVSYYKNKGICPATALVAQAELVQSVVDTFVNIAQVAKIGVVTVLDGQSLVDIANQYLGSADAAFDIAVLNGLSITDDLEIGRELKLPSVVNKKIAEYYKNKGICPATTIVVNNNDDGTNPPPIFELGLGYMALGIDFIIS